MRMPRLDSIDTITVLGGACLFFSPVVQRSFDQRSELYSEILCWTLLPILLRVRERLFKTSRYQDLSGDSDLKPTFLNNLWLWTIAASLATSCLYRSELGIVELQPILTPILLVVQTWIQSESASSATRLLSGTALCAVVGILSLSSGDIGRAALSLITVLPQLLVYIALLPKEVLGLCRLPVISDEGMDISRLCWRIVATLAMVAGIFAGIFGLIIPSITHTLATGVAKTMLWFSLLQLRRHAPWYIAPAIETFGLVTTRDPYVQSSESRAVFDVAATFVTLAQVVYIIPREAKARYGLWIFLLASIVPYLLNSLAIRDSVTPILRDHPVEMLVNNAKADFEALLQRQSKDVTAARHEYQRRYNMEPPPGFEEWFNFAMTQESPIIDEFDTIHDSVSPFWKMSGKEILLMMKRARQTSHTELWQCSFAGNSAKTTCTHREYTFDRHISLLFNKLLSDKSTKLPDVKFLVNGLDEPSVMIPPESLGTGTNGGEGHFNLTVMSRRPVWDELTRNCPSERMDVSSLEKPETFGMPFITDKSSSMDLCQNPEYRTTHGLLQRPSSFSLVEEPLPVLSPGVPSIMSDILYPSAAYIEEEFQYDDTHDPDWEDKWNNLYWAGSNTGGFSFDGQWRRFHRQRFVSLAQNLEQKSHVYLRKIGDSVERVGSTFLNARLYDVAFTRIFQCERSACRGQRTYFRKKPWADRYTALRSRLAFDLDGNGISGRYYQLLASKSLPLKQTLLREWHDDRLVPWAHYIPVSQSMDELPELVNYLTSSEIGRQKAREVAELGREWYAKAFREIDMSIYVYRLLLELARLQDPNREATVPAKR